MGSPICELQVGEDFFRLRFLFTRLISLAVSSISYFSSLSSEAVARGEGLLNVLVRRCTLC